MIMQIFYDDIHTFWLDVKKFVCDGTYMVLLHIMPFIYDKDIMVWLGIMWLVHDDMTTVLFTLSPGVIHENDPMYDWI